MPRASNRELRQHYRLYVMGGLALALALVLALFRFWPALPDDETLAPVYAASGEVIELKEIMPTAQAGERMPPPLSPLPPVEVPDDVVLEDVDIRFQDLSLLLEGPPPLTEAPPGAEGGNTQAPPQADLGPRPVRFVEPEYTQSARSSNVRATVVVRVLVGSTGRVEEATVTQRFLLEGESSREMVAHVGHGLEEAALSAARRWMFRPARENGQAVASYTTLTFSFGVDS